MKTLSLITILSLVLTITETKRVKDLIYRDITAATYCFRRTNGTHQFGCSSDFGGNVGVVHLIQDQTDVKFIAEKGSYGPYIAAFVPNAFNKVYLERLKDSGKLAGALLLNAKDYDFITVPAKYSDDEPCPNSLSSLYINNKTDRCDANHSPWNPAGTGLLQEDFGFPIFTTADLDTVKFIVEDCFNKFNKPTSEEEQQRDWPLCAIELKSHMYSAIDSETCIRRSNLVNVINPTRFCDPMGDNNYFLFAKDRSGLSNNTKENVLLLTTHLDTVTLFDMQEYGADSPATNIVALLEVARLVSSQNPRFDGKFSNILYAFFHGESFDYIGSSRFVYEVQQGQFPVKINAEDEESQGSKQPTLALDDIDTVLELGQLFNVKSGGRIFIHQDKNNPDLSLVKTVQDKLQSQSVTADVASKSVLPPSSLHSILKANGLIPAAFISDFDEAFSNNYYHSIYDQGAENLGYDYTKGENQEVVDHIAKVAAGVATFVLEQVSSSSVGIINANKTLINELLHCYLDTAKCDLFEAARTPSMPLRTAVPDVPWPMYVGVDWRSQYHGIYTRNVLALLTGERLSEDYRLDNCTRPETQDQDAFEYLFLKTEETPSWWDQSKPCNESEECGFCYKTLSFIGPAVSPAFVIDNYNFSSLEYKAWAESQWKTSSARIFLKASPSLESGYLAAGIVTLIFSFIVVFWLDRYSSLIFEGSSSTPASSTGVEASATRGSTSTTNTAAEPTAV